MRYAIIDKEKLTGLGLDARGRRFCAESKHTVITEVEIARMQSLEGSADERAEKIGVKLISEAELKLKLTTNNW